MRAGILAVSVSPFPLNLNEHWGAGERCSGIFWWSRRGGRVHARLLGTSDSRARWIQLRRHGISSSAVLDSASLLQVACGLSVYYEGMCHCCLPRYPVKYNRTRPPDNAGVLRSTSGKTYRAAGPRESSGDSNHAHAHQGVGQGCNAGENRGRSRPRATSGAGHI